MAHKKIQGAMHVLVVHFNTPELTSRLVKEFPAVTPSGREVFIHVLDNLSTAENRRVLEAHLKRQHRVSLEMSNRNLGFGEGINALADSERIADSDILWVLNPDTMLWPDCLVNLEDELDVAAFDIVSPLILSGRGTKNWIWFCGGSINFRSLRARHQLYGCSIDQAPRRTFETELMTGAAPMMFAKTFREIGGFPRGYFLYWEDVHFSWNARRMGYRLGVVPNAHLWHQVGASSGTSQSATWYYWSTRNRFTFAHDVGVPRRRLILGGGGIETLRPIAKALVTERMGRRTKAWAAIRGTARGFRGGRSCFHWEG